MVERTYSIPGAPRFALLSDLHDRPYEPVLACLRQKRPPLILIAGDVIYGSRPLDERSPLETQKNVLPLLQGCAELAPSFLSLGNHELHLDEKDLQTLRDTGVTLLENSFVTHGELVIGGLNSAYVTDHRRYVASLPAGERQGRYPARASLEGIAGVRNANRLIPDLSWLDAYTRVEGYHLLLCHHPEYWPRLRERDIQLMVSGHAHGGQVRLFGQGLFSPGQGVFPRYTRGLYEGRLLVSAGLSNPVWAPRLFNPEEIVYTQ